VGSGSWRRLEAERDHQRLLEVVVDDVVDVVLVGSHVRPVLDRVGLTLTDRHSCEVSEASSPTDEGEPLGTRVEVDQHLDLVASLEPEAPEGWVCGCHGLVVGLAELADLDETVLGVGRTKLEPGNHLLDALGAGVLGAGD
jgi:hypothetical protein